MLDNTLCIVRRINSTNITWNTLSITLLYSPLSRPVRRIWPTEQWNYTSKFEGTDQAAVFDELGVRKCC